MRPAYAITSLGLNIFWRLRPAGLRVSRSRELTDAHEQSTDEALTLRALIKRFPFWVEGRYRLAEESLASNDIATAYAEAQALQTLSPHSSHDKGRALFVLGRCYLRRGDGGAALTLLTEAAQLLPQNYLLQEEMSAALALEGNKAKALSVLKEIPEDKISAEGKAALRWLSATNQP
jgi:Flp pilus assembly protein TadD